jgi:hypothetical protein
MAQSMVPPSKEPNRAGDSPQMSGPLFSARASTLFRVGLGAAVLLVTGTGFMASAYFHSASWDGIGFAPAQPVRFSHKLHAGELRMDCRNCHATVETSAFAGMPSTETCLSCHSQLLTSAPTLQPVMASDAHHVPLQWIRVTRLPDHVYFDHSIHVNKGVGCTSCHGEVGEMAVIAQRDPLTMRWCLDCHRNPGPRLRPSSEIFAAISPVARPHDPREELMRLDHIHLMNLTDCSTCHH